MRDDDCHGLIEGVNDTAGGGASKDFDRASSAAGGRMTVMEGRRRHVVRQRVAIGKEEGGDGGMRRVDEGRITVIFVGGDGGERGDGANNTAGSTRAPDDARPPRLAATRTTTTMIDRPAPSCFPGRRMRGGETAMRQ